MVRGREANQMSWKKCGWRWASGDGWEVGFRASHFISKLHDSSAGVLIQCVKHFNSTDSFCKHCPEFSQLWAETVKLFSVAPQCHWINWLRREKKGIFMGSFFIMKIRELWEEGKKASAKPREEKAIDFYLLCEPVAGQLQLTRWWDQIVPEVPHGKWDKMRPPRN